MALIPYDKVPGDRDPPLQSSRGPIRELYCGDAHCDCLTGHLLVGNVPLAVDIGTGRLDFLDQQAALAHGPLREELDGVVRSPGVIERLRAHYQAVRRYGEEHHYEHVDWTALRPGDFVPWQVLFPKDRVALLPILKEPAAGEKGEAGEEAAPPAEAGKEPEYTDENIAFRLGLGDRYCVDPKCDCHRVMWEVVAMAPGDKNAVRPLGAVVYDFRKGQPAVQDATPGVDPDQLLYTVLLALNRFPGIVAEHAARYARIRQLLIPLAARQRREREAAQSNLRREAGRNEPCPCGSGKKYKKCHGAKTSAPGTG